MPGKGKEIKKLKRAENNQKDRIKLLSTPKVGFSCKKPTVYCTFIF